MKNVIDIYSFDVSVVFDEAEYQRWEAAVTIPSSF